MVSIESRCIAPRVAPRGRLAAAALAACLLACGGAYAASPPPREILVVTDINYPPYLFQTDDGELQGILRDKWALWSQRTGIPARILGMEWIKAQESVQEGAADVIETLSYVEANPASQHHSGYTREEMIGRNSLELGLWPDPEDRRRFVADLLRDGMVESRELRLRRSQASVPVQPASAPAPKEACSRVTFMLDKERRRMCCAQDL